MDAQQLATKVTQLESRVATLEDEGKIIKGEVKQILTEIRSAILIRDNPFESDGLNAPQRPTMTFTPQPVTKLEVVMSEHEQPQHHESAPAHEFATTREKHVPPPHAAVDAHAPVPLRPHTAPQATQSLTPPPESEKPKWSLLTIAGLAAWSEEAMSRLGSLRLEILLDLCEAAGHISPDAREALARVTELDIAEPQRAPSTNETVVILRQLDALVTDEEDSGPSRMLGLL